jgi:hypothetical protein
MVGYRELDPKQRQSNAAAAKKALLEKFRAATQGFGADERARARKALKDKRLARAAEREISKAKLKAEQAESEAALLREQKAQRDARYADRKATKKIRRRGY